MQVTVKFTGHVVQCSDLKRVIGNPSERTDALNALDLVLRQGALLKPEYVYCERVTLATWSLVNLRLAIAIISVYLVCVVLNFLQNHYKLLSMKWRVEFSKLPI